MVWPFVTGSRHVILRGVTYTEQPRMLKAEEPVAAPSISMLNTSALAVAQVALSAPEPKETLNFESVLEWVNSQDQQTQLRIARSLDDQLEQIRAEAVIEGRAAGAIAAKVEVKSQCTAAIEALHSLTANAEQIFEQRYEQLVNQCADIVGEALCKLAGTALLHPDACIATVREAVGFVRGARHVVIRVNAYDLEAVSSFKHDIAEILGDNAVSIIADPRVTSGGCLIDSSFGEVDARWETKLRSLFDALRGTRSSAGSEQEQSS